MDALGNFHAAAALAAGTDMYLSLIHIYGNAAMDTLKAEGALKFDFGAELVVLTEEDLLIDMAQTEGYVSESDNVVTVALDTRLTPELLEEGFVRELVSKIQTMRKEAGFEVMDHICIYQQNKMCIRDSFDTYADATMDVIVGDYNPTGKMPITLPKNDEVIAVNADGVCISPNDVPGYLKDQYMPEEMKDRNGKAYAYRDSENNYYELNYGLSYEESEKPHRPSRPNSSNARCV